MASKTSTSNTSKIKIGRRNGRIVLCPECKTKYARVEAELPKQEICGVCEKEITLQ